MMIDKTKREANKIIDDNSLIHGFNDGAPVKQVPEEEPYIEGRSKIHGFNDDVSVKKEPEEEPYIEDRSKIHGFNDGASASADGFATASESATVYHSLDDRPNYDPDSYVPSDFEPDLDPYDRQALYDEEVIDDWVIAGGGDPLDFDDRMDALTDPFGFGDDDDSWD